MSEPFISVVIPVYNMEKYLSQCVDSVLDQDFSDYEIILVDDSSTDKSGTICDDYAAANSKIRVLHKQNQGLYLARKSGIEIAAGQYITFLDSDDWIENGMLSEMHRLVHEYNAEIICVQMTRQDNRTKTYSINPKTEIISICHTPDEWCEYAFNSRLITTSACGKLLKKELLNNIKYKSNLAIGEEHDMVFQLLEKAKIICTTNKPLYFYFVNNNGISHSGYNPKYKNSLDNYIELRKSLSASHPTYSKNINAFFLEYEMAVITAMCRNNNFDWEVVGKLKSELKTHFSELLTNKYTKFYYKASTILILTNTKLFCTLFKLLRKFVGR